MHIYKKESKIKSELLKPCMFHGTDIWININVLKWSYFGTSKMLSNIAKTF